MIFSIDTNEPGVSARFANGAKAQGDGLIGADGLRSVVRGWLGHADRIRYSGYTAWRSVVTFDHSLLVAREGVLGRSRFMAIGSSGLPRAMRRRARTLAMTLHSPIYFHCLRDGMNRSKR